MKTDTRYKIFKYILENNPVSINDIKLEFGISNQMIHRHIKKLFEEDKIYKVGNNPKVYYFPTDIAFIQYPNGEVQELKEKNEGKYIINNKYNSFFDINKFVYFGPDGELKYGYEGFENWCEKRNMNFEKEFEFYKKTLDKYNQFKTKYGLIKGIDKMKSTFDNVYLDKVYYLDFYSIEKYGKTYLGNLMFYAKQTGDRELADKILGEIRDAIYNLIRIKKIDAFAFIPPSIDRKVQLMDELKNGLGLHLKELNLIKLFRDKVVAQKSLSKKIDRIENARETIFVLDKKFKSDTILLIDDAVGSGATLNETAKKIKKKGFAKKVIGLAIVGSYKGFEVINEV